MCYRLRAGVLSVNYVVFMLSINHEQSYIHCPANEDFDEYMAPRALL